MNVVDVWTGRMAKALRSTLRLSREAFAQQLGVVTRTVANWEAKLDQPLTAHAHDILDTALQQATEDARRRFWHATGSQGPATPNVLRMTPAPSFPSPLSLAGRGTLGHEVVEFLSQSRVAHVAGDRLLGPRHVLSAAVANAHLIPDALSHSRGDVRKQLLQVGARYAELVGWLYQDVGDKMRATYWSDRALEWAHEINDPQLIAYVLFRKSNQAGDEQDFARSVSLAEAARRDGAKFNLRIEALSLRQEALGYALQGDEVSCHRRLDRAVELAAMAVRAEGDNGPGRYCDETYIDSQRALCWLELGRPERAVALLNKALMRWPQDQYRDRGLAHARLALAHAELDDLRSATSHAREALAIWVTSGSSRIMRELDKAVRRLTGARSQPEIEQFIADFANTKSGTPVFMPE